MSGITRVPKATGKIISSANFRRAYSGIGSSDESAVVPVLKSASIQKNKDFYGSGLKQYGRMTDYKEEYRKYYSLEQELEETFNESIDPDDFIEVIYEILTQTNEVIKALIGFDKIFHTCYTQEINYYFKKYEEELTSIGILIHVDTTLGFFKGRMRNIYDVSPEKFMFLVRSPQHFVKNLIEHFRQIKAVIPERIEDLPLHDNAQGAIIDKKL